MRKLMGLIKTEKEYNLAMKRLMLLMDQELKPNSEAEAEFELLSLLIEAYERSLVPAVKPDPIEAILFRMEQQNLSRKDLIPYLGSLSKISEVLSGKRSLSLAMIRKLNQGLGISAEILLQESKTTKNNSREHAAK